MSPKLPVISGREAMGAFLRLGYEIVRQRGSHVRLRHPSDARRKPLTVADHRILKPGLLRKMIRDAQLDVEGFLRLIHPP